ncbi:DUF1648 domain-containing protein [Streptomyces spirodelae]|uniref:DUF1648 domain-containing protein n=1 Tax=Streptomyces spirodelae TaxID=2812904 RepID=A0ABS3WYX9_9ACTN|nr:DUF1648 domain-containing protein [Streptomyces spirodelae]MBO8188329.1 DUF1648 domain-containing protein [Streptomyces spirodelae]
MGGDRDGDGAGRRADGGADFPWLWLAPGLLILVGLLVWGVVVYPDLPAKVPQHIGSDGVDRYGDKSVGTVFLPVFVHAGTLALLAGTAYATLRMTPTSELGAEQRTSSLVNRPRDRASARRIARLLLILGFCLGLTMTVTCTVMWSTTPPKQGEELTGKLVLALLPVALGTLALLVTALRDRVGGAGRKRPTSG